jgi:hypothetical protein
MTGRRVCPQCGATYHLISKPPKVAETCDLDGSRLERPPDDKAQVVEFRQEVYDEHATPILRHYQDKHPDLFRQVDGEQPFEAVYAQARRRKRKVSEKEKCQEPEKEKCQEPFISNLARHWAFFGVPTPLTPGPSPRGRGEPDPPETRESVSAPQRGQTLAIEGPHGSNRRTSCSEP